MTDDETWVLVNTKTGVSLKLFTAHMTQGAVIAPSVVVEKTTAERWAKLVQDRMHLDGGIDDPLRGMHYELQDILDHRNWAYTWNNGERP